MSTKRSVSAHNVTSEGRNADAEAYETNPVVLRGDLDPRFYAAIVTLAREWGYAEVFVPVEADQTTARRRVVEAAKCLLECRATGEWEARLAWRWTSRELVAIDPNFAKLTYEEATELCAPRGSADATAAAWALRVKARRLTGPIRQFDDAISQDASRERRRVVESFKVARKAATRPKRVR